jgi:hypothetical protein
MDGDDDLSAIRVAPLLMASSLTSEREAMPP